MSMSKVADLLAAELVESLKNKDASARVCAALSGIPGSGKSSFCKTLMERTNELLSASGPDKCCLVGLDGWHLTRAQLDALPDPKLAHERRGIHWTFDGPGYLEFVLKLREPITEQSLAITAPTFDHALKDPVVDAVSIKPHHRIVIIEGLYPFLNIEPWNKAAAMLDHRIFLTVDLEVAKIRLAKRHVVSGITSNLQDGLLRAENNDLPNGRFVMENMLEPSKFIECIEDPMLVL
ncbi:P-loop containing nucleoside triphosphate hydrolase protein [Mycena floridula]|nr:P-loop containing nucleoside triphosphate hydrolase protein [Mycena floridula]